MKSTVANDVWTLQSPHDLPSPPPSNPHTWRPHLHPHPHRSCLNSPPTKILRILSPPSISISISTLNVGINMEIEVHCVQLCQRLRIILSYYEHLLIKLCAHINWGGLHRHLITLSCSSIFHHIWSTVPMIEDHPRAVGWSNFNPNLANEM